MRRAPGRAVASPALTTPKAIERKTTATPDKPQAKKRGPRASGGGPPEAGHSGDGRPYPIRPWAPATGPDPGTAATRRRSRYDCHSRWHAGCTPPAGTPPPAPSRPGATGVTATRVWCRRGAGTAPTNWSTPYGTGLLPLYGGWRRSRSVVPTPAGLVRCRVQLVLGEDVAPARAGVVRVRTGRRSWTSSRSPPERGGPSRTRQESTRGLTEECEGGAVTCALLAAR